MPNKQACDVRQPHAAVKVRTPPRQASNATIEASFSWLAARLPPECPQSGQLLENTRWRPLELDTVSGKVQLRDRHGYQAQQERWICPARVAWGLQPYERKTPELQARLAYTAAVLGSQLFLEQLNLH